MTALIKVIGEDLTLQQLRSQNKSADLMWSYSLLLFERVCRYFMNDKEENAGIYRV